MHTGLDAVSTPARRWSPVFLAAVTALYIAAFLPTFRELVAYWWDHPEYSHGFLMPLVAAWILWERRSELSGLRASPSVLGLTLLVFSLLMLLLGELKLSWFLKPYAMVAALTGLIWTFWGWKSVRAMLPALVVLFLMCPLPGRVQNAITLPLKQSAATLATGLLDVSGISASLEGNLIHVPGTEGLWVADACSGISSLISLTTLALISCFFWDAPKWLKGVVVVSAVPIAVFVNGLRIWLTGVLAVKVGPEAAAGFFHFFEGFALFVVGGILLLGWAFLLDRVRRAFAS